MQSLAELQSAFAGALCNERNATSAACLFAGDGQSAAAGLAIYRGNVRAKAARALANAYPVTARIVGAEFFAALARAYCNATPFNSADLNGYGADFAGFLQSFEPVRDLPYLADVARLEWLLHRAYFAADGGGLDAAALAVLTPSQQENLRFELHPATGLLQSPYPVLRILEIHEPDFAGSMEIEALAAPQYVLVSRARFQPETAALDAGEFAFLCAVQRGASLSEALSAALAANDAFNLETALASWVARRVITGFTLPASLRPGELTV